ncbi:hypothetical protein BLOT_003343 [Blomia tropicalis]|nr:hypothetical protein BLOT_003343 [Blomia tropicalis]
MTKANVASIETKGNQTFVLPVPKHRNINEYVRESQLLLWIWRMISEISCFDYEQYLRDGVILCQLIETLAPSPQGSEPRPMTGGDHKRVKHDNIVRFLDSCRTFGLHDDELFDVEDLLSMQDIPRVTRCLYSLGKHAAEKFGKPELGKPYDEWLDEQLKGDQLVDNFNRRSGMPMGDDLYVAHVNTSWLKDRLEKRRAAAAAAIHRPPREPLVQRTSSKPISELKALFAENENKEEIISTINAQ